MKFEINVEKRHLYILSVLVVLIGGVLFVKGQSSGFGHGAEDVYVIYGEEEKNLQELFDEIKESERITYTVSKEERGTSLIIPEEDVARLCSDEDGCRVRIGMYDWNGNEKVAYRGNLVYYNEATGGWYAGEWGFTDKSGVNGDGAHDNLAVDAWNCYFSDGLHEDYVKIKDEDRNFGLVAWKHENSGCWLTIID